MAPLGAGVAEASLALLLPAPSPEAPSPPAGPGSAGAVGSEGPPALPDCAGAAIDRPGCIAAAALLCNSLSSPAPPAAPDERLEGLGGCQSGPSPAGAGAPLFLQGWGVFALSVPGLCPPAPGSVPHQPGLGTRSPPGAQRVLPAFVPLCSHCVPSPLPARPCPFPVPPALPPPAIPIAARSNPITSPLTPARDRGEGGLEKETEAGEEGTGTCGTAGDRPWLPALAEMEIQRRAWKPPEILAGGGGSAACAAVRVPRRLQPPAPRRGCRRIWGARS